LTESDEEEFNYTVESEVEQQSSEEDNVDESESVMSDKPTRTNTA
jgi:hypothetical protein